MVYIEPCEVEELGSCCVCEYTPEGEDDGGGDGGGGDGIDPECGVPWGGECESDDDCGGSWCCRNLGSDWTNLYTPYGMQSCGSGPCKRCWDCDGEIDEGCSACGSGAYNCDTCSIDEHFCTGGCTHGFACDPLSCGWSDYPQGGWHDPIVHGGCDWDDTCGPHYHGPGPCQCMGWEWVIIPDDECENLPSYVPDYYWCNPDPGQGPQLEDQSLGACCKFVWISGSGYEFVECEMDTVRGCTDGYQKQANVYWGPGTSCEDFEECCGDPHEEGCQVDDDCESGYCCSDFGNCVTCSACECTCTDSLTEWECCEQSEQTGFWHAGETCESYDCEEDCPEEPECTPSNPCPLCFSCEDGGCVPECSEDSDCSTNSCCEDGCCLDCDNVCQQDSDCSGEQCCKNGSCTYNCPDCEDDDECPGEQECEDGICVDPDPPDDCVDDSDCPQAKCCEDGECVACDPDPPEEDEEGACCGIESGSCSISDAASCNGWWFGVGSSCDDIVCPGSEDCDCDPNSDEECGWYCGGPNGEGCDLWCCLSHGYPTHCYTG